MAETFLTVKQAASRLQIAPYTLREWIKQKKIRAIKIGRAWRIPESTFDEIVARAERQPVVSHRSIPASQRFAGKLSSRSADKLQKHITQSRHEWNENI